MGLSQGTMASILQKGVSIHVISLLVQDSPQHSLFLWFQGKIKGGVSGDGDRGSSV